MYRAYTLDFFGPNAEFVTRLFPIAIYPSQGQSWEQEWWQLFYQRLGQLGNFNLGPTTPSPVAQVLFAKSLRAGIPVYERAIQGTLSGRPVEGKLFAQVADTGYSLLLYGSVLLCPRGYLDNTINALAYITSTTQENPQYQTKSRQLMVQRSQTHHAIMRNNRNWFEQHMTSMRQMSALQSQSNQQFSAHLKSSGYSGAPQQPYTSNDYFTDHIKDSTSFNGPYSGHRITQQGQYEYWYTDRLGNYHGTNDPNFTPNQLNGNWYPISPLERQ